MEDIDNKISNLQFVVHPELLAASIQKRMLDLFIIWLIVKAIDSQRYGRGLMKFDKLHNLVCGILGYNKAYAYQKIKRGIGVFWTEPSGGKGDRQIALISKRKVYDWLDPDMVQSQPFIRTIGDFLPSMTGEHDSIERGTAKIKRLAFEMIAARHTNNRPVSYESIAGSTGVSRRTAMRHIQGAFTVQESQLYKRPNFVKLFTTPRLEEAIRMLQAYKKLSPFGKMPYRFVKQSGKFIVAQQQGNTYYMPEHMRLPLHIRPDILKIRDIGNGCRATPRLYCTSQKHTLLSTTSAKYFKPAGSGHILNIGRVNLWQPVGEVKLPALVTANEQLRNEHIRPWIKAHVTELKKISDNHSALFG